MWSIQRCVVVASFLRYVHVLYVILFCSMFFFFFQAEDGIRDYKVTGVQTCALPILTCSRHFPILSRTPAPRRFFPATEGLWLSGFGGPHRCCSLSSYEGVAADPSTHGGPQWKSGQARWSITGQSLIAAGNVEPTERALRV